MTEQEVIRSEDALLSEEQAVTSAQHLMAETMLVLGKRKGLRASHFSMDSLIDVITSTTFDGELVSEATYMMGKEGQRTLRRIVYFDRGKRCFELGYGDEKVLDPLTHSFVKVTRGVLRYEKNQPNSIGTQRLITDKLARLQKAYA